MDKTMENLRGRFDEFSRQANKLLADKGDAVWTEEEQASFDALVDKMEACKKQMKSIEALREAEADKYFDAVTKPTGPKDSTVTFPQAFEALIRRGFDNLSAEEREILRPMNATQSGANKGTNSAGGYTVPEELATYVIDKLKAFGGMRSAAKVITTDTGITMKWPTSDGTSEVGEIVAENNNVSQLLPTFGIASLDVFKYSSKSVAISWELLQDTGIDILRFITDRLATRIARIQNQHFTTGTGSGQPTGLLTAGAANTANVANVTTANTIKYDDLIETIHKVDPAYRNNCAWMMSDATLATIRKLKDTTNRPLWGADNLLGGAPGSLLGYKIIINQDMNASYPIAFGDFSSYIIRDVRGSMEMRRFDDSKYAEYGQAGFCQWIRSGGTLLVPSGVALLSSSVASGG